MGGATHYQDSEIIAGDEWIGLSGLKPDPSFGSNLSTQIDGTSIPKPISTINLEHTDLGDPAAHGIALNRP